MATRILHTGDYGRAILYCSTTDWAFGPVFDEDDEHDATSRAEAFLEWLKTDPRLLSDAEMSARYTEWLAQEQEQWKQKESVWTEED